MTIAKVNAMRCLSLLAVLLLLGISTRRAAGQDAEAEAKELVARAQQAAKAEKLDEAVALVRKAIQLTPTNDTYLSIASEMEYHAGMYTDGMAHALEAIKLNDKVAAYYVMAASHAYWLHELDQARAHCDTVLKRGKEFGPGAVQAVQVLQDQMGKKVFTLLFTLDPKKGRMVNGALPIAMPKDGMPYQHVTYEIKDVKSHKLIKGDIDDVLQVVPMGTMPFPLTIKITTEPYVFNKELAKAAAKPLPADAKAQLGSLVAIDPKSPVLQKVVANLKGTDTKATLYNLLDWQNKNITYKLKNEAIDELDFKSVDEIVKRGNAECRGHALLFTGLCRAAGIPARPIWGIVRLPPGADRKLGDIVSHNWVEVYIAGAGWIPVDPRRPATLGFLPNYYMRMYMDGQKTSTSSEALPQMNLMYMNGPHLRYEEAR
jgi:tetratricopeptide (TPR) repeat protein